MKFTSVPYFPSQNCSREEYEWHMYQELFHQFSTILDKFRIDKIDPHSGKLYIQTEFISGHVLSSRYRTFKITSTLVDRSRVRRWSLGNRWGKLWILNDNTSRGLLRLSSVIQSYISVSLESFFILLMAERAWSLHTRVPVLLSRGVSHAISTWDCPWRLTQVYRQLLLILACMTHNKRNSLVDMLKNTKNQKA